MFRQFLSALLWLVTSFTGQSLAQQTVAPPSVPVDRLAQAWDQLNLDVADFDERLNDWAPHCANLILINGDDPRPTLLVRPAMAGSVLAFQLRQAAIGQPVFQITPELIGPLDIQQMRQRDLDGDGIDELILIRASGVVDIHPLTDARLTSPMATLKASHSILDVACYEGGVVTIHENSSIEFHELQKGWRFSSARRQFLVNGNPVHLQAIAVDPIAGGPEILVFTDSGAYRTNSLGYQQRLWGFLPEALEPVVNVHAWSSTTDALGRGLADRLLLQQRIYDANGRPSSTRLTVFVAGTNHLWAQSSCFIANDAVHFSPVDIDRDGWTDLAFMQCLNSSDRRWGAILGSTDGLGRRTVDSLNCAQVLAAAATPRLPTLELPISSREEVTSTYSLRSEPGYSADGVTPEMIEKLCMMLENMRTIAQALVDSGNTEKGNQLGQLVTDLTTLKAAGKLKIECLDEGTLGETNKATGAVSISKGLFSDLEALCSFNTFEAWQLVRILIHEALHTQCVGDEDGHPQVQVETICILNAIAELNVDDRGNVLPMPGGFLLAKGLEKMYILRTEQILLYLELVCMITGNGDVLEESLRQSLARVFALCQVPFDETQMTSSNTTNPDGSVTATASYDGVTMTLNWENGCCKFVLEYCGAEISEKL